MGGGNCQGHHHPHTPLAVDRRQCGSRFLDTKHTQSVGLQVGPRCFLHDTGNLPSETNSRCICVKQHSSVTEVHDLVSRQECSGAGCPSSSLGQGHISVPSCSFAAEGDHENSTAADQGSVGVSSVADISMVATGIRDVGGTTVALAALQECSNRGRRGANSAISGSLGSTAPFRREYGLSHASSGLDEEDLSFLSNHLAFGTKTGYGYIFKRFRTFCETLGHNPFTCAPTIIVKYIRTLYDSGAQYSTVNHHRSSISKFHIGFGNLSAGAHPLVSQAVKAVFRLRPPLPKYMTTFDICRVFTHIQSLPPNEELSLKTLSFKTLFLLTAATISRMSSVCRLGPVLRVFEVSYYNEIIYCIVFL